MIGQGALHRLALRRRRRATRLFAWLLVALGTLALLDAATTLLWQEPLSALYAQLRQNSLARQLRTLERAPPPPSAQLELERLRSEQARIAYLASRLEHHARAGAAVGRIEMRRIGVSFVIVKGTGSSELQSGPGIYPQTAFPGVPGATTAIAGHRTTFLAPFRHIDALRRGDQIVLEMPYGRFAYEVTGSRVVLPADVSVIDPVGYPRLVLSACTPLFSASHRIVVFARLHSIQPRGAARPKAGPAPEVRYPAQARPPGRAPSPPKRLPQVLEPLKRLPLSLVA